MLRTILVLLTILTVETTHGQVISQFSFDVGPVTTADVGPDATAVSGSAISDAGGVGGTNGMNAGLPKADINMVIPGSPTFDVDGIDVSFDYHREENSGNFFVRGSSLIIRGCANLSVSYRVDDGGGGFITVNSGNVYSIPNDDIYRNYRFGYTDCDGVGVLMVDGVVVWSNDGPDNTPMYWTGAGNVIVCQNIDGTGFNDTFFDNLIIGEVECSLLPIQLTRFDIRSQEGCGVRLDWETASEINNDYFIIQRSEDGENWSEIAQINGAGNASSKQIYRYYDASATQGVYYYRLVQVDFDGATEMFDAKKVYPKCELSSVYPNPTKGLVTVNGLLPDAHFEVFDLAGRRVTNQVVFHSAAGQLDLSALSAGSYFIQINDQTYPVQLLGY